MKSFKLYLSLALIATFGLVSCSDNFDAPPLNVPESSWTANTTIADFKLKYWQDETNYIDTVKVAEGAEAPVIAGTVVSSDATGNIYKSLVIQDKTAAIAISINANSLYATYRVGQKVVINLKDMYVGKYQGLEQLGAPGQSNNGTWQASFMALEFFQEHAQLSGLPNLADVDTLTTTLAALPTEPEDICKMQSRLIRLDDMSWVEAGEPYSASDASTSRNLMDAAGQTIIVRNSNYATFRAELLPSGRGSVVGILSYYGSAWQLLLRSADDVFGFHEVEGGKGLPYSVAQAISMQGTSTSGWVEGYIVGAVSPEVDFDVTSSSDIEWKAPTILGNTIVIAPTAETTDITKCLIVSLTSGSALRTTANLKDNPGVYKKKIKLTGEFRNQFGQPGVKTAGASADFEIE